MSIAQQPNAKSFETQTNGLLSHYNVNNQSGGKLPSPISSTPSSPRSTSPSLDSSNSLKSSISNENRKEKREKKVQSPAPTETRCLARVSTGEQCKRSRNEGSDLCTCHSKNLPYGKINGPLEGKFLSLPKKRGPRFKNQTSFQLTAENQHHYVATQLINIDESLYLIDELGLLYSNDKRGEIVGRRLMNEIHWYS